MAVFGWSAVRSGLSAGWVPTRRTRSSSSAQPASPSGDLVAADALFARPMAIWRSKPITSTHDGPTGLLVRVGALRLQQARLDEARSTLSVALARRRASLPEGHWRLAEAQSLLGACLSPLGRFAQAEPLLAEGLPGNPGCPW